MKSKRFLASSLIFGMILMTGCSNPFDSSYDIKYEVKGTASSVFLTYQNASGGTSQADDVNLPWTIQFDGHADDFVYISAQNNDSTGTVTATIYRDGSVFKTSTSSGAYVIATASGSI